MRGCRRISYGYKSRQRAVEEMELNFVRERSVPLRSNAGSAKKTTGGRKTVAALTVARGGGGLENNVAAACRCAQQPLADVSYASRLSHQLSSKHPENASSLAGRNN